MLCILPPLKEPAHNFLNHLSLVFLVFVGLFCFYKQDNIKKSTWEQVLGPEVLIE